MLEYMKKITSILLHPLFIALLFCVLIISGESNAAFYLSIILLGLPYGAIHAIVGVVGIALMVIAMALPKKYIAGIVSLLGALCLFFSLFRFFTQPGGSYNYNTFREAVPFILIILFCVLNTLFIIKHLQILLKSDRSLFFR